MFPFDKRAWHAGESSWKGEERCNDFSIGIEMEGSDEEPYTDIQYQRLAILANKLIAQYPFLKRDAICGHSDIAPERKTDPGKAFNWHYFYTLLDKKS